MSEAWHHPKPERVSTVTVDLPYGEFFHLTPLSDLHIENTNFPEAEFDEFMSQRATLPNSYFILLGDTMDLITTRDPRFRQSVRPATLPVVVVGHQPTLGELVSRLLGADVDDWPIRKGAVVWLAGREDDDRSHVVLRAAISPDLL